MRGEGLVLAFALAFPTVLAYGYFVAVAGGGGPNVAVQAVWLGGKAVQLLLPLLWLWYAERRLPRPAWPTGRGLGWGVGFGLAVAAVMLGLYFGLLRDSAAFVGFAERAREKAAEFGLSTPATYVFFAALASTAHALLEEYYWRWFVFGRLRLRVKPVPAALLASAGFLAFHLVDLAFYFPGRFWTGAVPLALAVGGGSMAWCWMYHRSGSLAPSWVSHLLIDVAMFAVGYDLCFR